MSQAPHEPPSPAVLRRASSAPEMERKLRTALAIEHQRRVVAEGRAQQIASLSPVEQAMLAAWARTARLLHAPKPRCLCCGGPLFWMCIVPWLCVSLFTGGSPLVLIAPAPPAEADTPTLRAPAAGLFHARGTPTRKKPVLIVPGMTSTALEVWRGTGCYKGAHRRRLWSFRESFTLAVDPSCLRRHLALNKTTWDDLEGISVRASTGLSAADAFGPLNLVGRTAEKPGHPRLRRTKRAPPWLRLAPVAAPAPATRRLVHAITARSGAVEGAEW